MWAIAEFLDKYGVPVGFLLVVLPLAYDVLGWMYGRHIGIDVANIGGIIQILGVLMMLSGKYIYHITEFLDRR